MNVKISIKKFKNNNLISRFQSSSIRRSVGHWKLYCRWNLYLPTNLVPVYRWYGCIRSLHVLHGGQHHLQSRTELQVFIKIINVVCLFVCLSVCLSVARSPLKQHVVVSKCSIQLNVSSSFLFLNFIETKHSFWNSKHASNEILLNLWWIMPKMQKKIPETLQTIKLKPLINGNI